MSATPIIPTTTPLPKEIIGIEQSTSPYLFYIKFLYVFIIMAITTIFGLLPLCFNKCRKGNRFLNYANAFSGGIFLGIGFFHLFPEANENFENYYKTPSGASSFMFGWPMSYLIAFLSYSLILYIEKVAFNSHDILHHHQSQDDKEKTLNEPLIENQQEDESEDSGKDEGIRKNKYIFNSSSSITPYILLIALSIHSIFEGIALGVMNTFRDCTILFTAIIMHKWAASFALGISFYKSGIDTDFFIKMILLFSLFGPVGIIIGMFFSEAGSLMKGIMLSLSGGTFIYVAASEVLVEEFSISKSKNIKFFCYLFGGLLTFILTLVE